MPALIVLNGPPAAGKSTLARVYVEHHPMALRIDIDEIRDLLGCRRQDLSAAGIRARALATAMAADHLRAGHDVVIAQAYAQPDHLDELAALAAELEVAYREIVLLADKATIRERFTSRGGARLAEALAHPEGLDAVTAFGEDVEMLARARPQSRFVESSPGDIDATYHAVLAATADGS